MTEDDDLPPLGEGDILAGKYRVERVLGVGGVGVVVAAVHVTLGQRVALKFLRKSAARDAASIERFLREARAVVRLKSLHAIRVQDVGTLDSGEPYMVMELLEGCDFATLLEQRGHLSVSESVSYVLQACEALAEAHAAGVVHRDLKPENLFLTTGVDHTPLVKVLDFGLVKEIQPRAASSSEKSLTGELAMGTPAYMSPEQIKSTRDVDARADIWSIGVVLYELLSGQAPFVAESVPELIAAIVRDTPSPLVDVAPAVPARLGDVVARCLEKNPENRFQKISKLAAALDEFVAPPSSRAGARLGLVQPSSAPPPTPAIAWQPDYRAPSPLKRAAVASALTLDEVPRVTESGTTEPVTEDPTPARSRALAWPLAAVGVAAIGALAYIATHRPTVVAPPVIVPTNSAITPEIDAGASASATASATPQLSATPQVATSGDRSGGMMPGSTSKTKGHASTTPKGSHGGKDASTEESRLLETR